MGYVYYHEIIPGNAVGNNLLQVLLRDSSLDALIINADPIFPARGETSILPVIEEFTTRGIPVFLISGQHGMYEQQVIEENEEKAMAAGAISLGACTTPWYELAPRANDIFSQPAVDLATKIQQVVGHFYRPALGSKEFGPILDFLIDGGSIELGKFVYHHYELWEAVKASHQYKPLADAAAQSFAQIAPILVDEMTQRGLQDYYSMGPTPAVDAHILEAFVRAKKEVRYHAIDVNAHALFTTKRLITEHLAKIDPEWEKYVTLIEERPQVFGKVKTAQAVCVAYPGGQIVNDPKFLQQAAKICQQGGVVVADVHARYDVPHDEAFWKSIYDIEEERAMFRHAVGLLVPGLLRESGWDIKVEYLSSEEGPHRVSFQLDVQQPLETYCNMVKIRLEPGKRRELMISQKYTLPEFTTHAAMQGYTMLRSTAVPIQSTSHPSLGAVVTAILGYKCGEVALPLDRRVELVA